MDTEAVKNYCASLPGAATRLHEPPWNVLVYSVGERRFAYFKTSDPERWRFSVKVTPDRFLELTDMPGVKPARFMGRYRWITIVDVRRFPADYLRELIDWSYRHALEGLSKKRRAEALGGGEASVRGRLTK